MTTAVSGNHLGMPLEIDPSDHENRAFFGYLASGELRLQKCTSCGLLRYPPGTGCPFCGYPDAEWHAVDPRGTVYTYAEVHHAIQPAFRDHVPYLIVIVELDTQSGQPGPNDGLRIAGNLVTADGELASPELVRTVGIGTRVRMVFKAVGDDFALPMFAADDTQSQLSAPWRYPGT
ncbi:MAG: OB-fold domain-containing protein [Pseudomonadota bacterium]